MALDLANARLATEREALAKARADIEAARAEAVELADKLAGEVEALQSRLASIEAAEQAARTETDELRAKLAAAQEQVHTAEARAVEFERRAGELRTELDRAHRDADQARQALAEQQKVNQVTTEHVDRLRDELATVKAKVEAADQAHHATKVERDQARQEASKAREDAARLAGQLQAQQEQAAAILARLALPADAKSATTTTRKKADKGSNSSPDY